MNVTATRRLKIVSERIESNAQHITAVNGRIRISGQLGVSIADSSTLARLHDEALEAARAKHMEWTGVHVENWKGYQLGYEGERLDKKNIWTKCIEVSEIGRCGLLALRELERAWAQNVRVVVSGKNHDRVSFLAPKPCHRRIVEQLRTHSRYSLMMAVGAVNFGRRELGLTGWETGEEQDGNRG